ncbi:hemolysin III family protein [Streptomyces sp. M19]
MALTALADSPRGRPPARSTPSPRARCSASAPCTTGATGAARLSRAAQDGPRQHLLIIAGTYTPFTLLLLPDGKQQLLLWLVWAGALAGSPSASSGWARPLAVHPCYIALGWAAVFFLPDFLRTGGIAVMTLIIVGGVLYSLGAVVYGTKRPNPWPRWFGFHEVFHSFTLAAFVVHYVGISLVAYQHG